MRDGLHSADGREVYAPAPRGRKRNILYGGSYWPREDAWFTAACDADEEHPGRVTLYTSRERRRTVDGSTAGPGG